MKLLVFSTCLVVFLILAETVWAAELLPPTGLVFTDISDSKHNTLDLFEKPTLVFFQGEGCPISNRQLLKIDDFEKKYADQFNILRVELNGGQFASSAPKKDSVINVQDTYKTLARYLKPQTMTESFLIADNKILYRGALDNQFGLFNTRDENIKNYLQEAIDEYLTTKKVLMPNTLPYGCFVDYGNKTGKMTYREFVRDIVPIIERRCLQCHAERPGLNFSNYDTVVKFKDMIGYVVRNDIMPPWAAEGHNWKNDLRLTKSEKKKIENWVNSEDAAIDKRKTEIVFKIPKKNEIVGPAFEKIEIPVGTTVIEARQKSGYRYFKFALNNDEPMWIDFIQFKSKVDLLLHHATIIVRNKEFEKPIEGFHDSGGHMLVGTTGIWKYYRFANNPAGFYIPKKAWFYIEAHYEGSGKDETENLTAVIYKFKKAPVNGLFTAALIVPPNKINIPPNTADFHIEKTLPMLLDEKTSLIAVNAHMHARGTKILFQLVKSSGKKIDILKINKYRHKLQRAYFLAKPLVVDKGDRLDFNAWYDNTRDNLSNPDPNAFVNGGLTSNDEMGVGTVWLKARSNFVKQLMNNYIYN